MAAWVALPWGAFGLWALADGRPVEGMLALILATLWLIYGKLEETR